MGARRVRHSPPEDIEVIFRDSFPVAQAAIALREAPYTRGATLGECASGRKVVPSGVCAGIQRPLVPVNSHPPPAPSSRAAGHQRVKTVASTTKVRQCNHGPDDQQ